MIFDMNSSKELLEKFQLAQAAESRSRGQVLHCNNQA